MLTLLPSGARRISETVPTWTPDISTLALAFKPPTSSACKRSVYVRRKKVLPLLSCSSNPASSANPMATNSPTFHSRPDLFISKVILFRIGNAFNEPPDDRVGRAEDFIRRARGVNFLIVQHHDALAYRASAAHIVSDDYRSDIQPVAHT